MTDRKKPVLDACCSTRMMWFDKQDARALYVDKREGTRIIDVGTPGTIGRTPKTVAPDMLVDFRNSARSTGIEAERRLRRTGARS